MEGFRLHMPVLVAHKEFLARIQGEDDFMLRSEELLKPGFYAIMTKVANALNAAQLKGSQLMRVEIIVHTQKEDEE